MLREYPDQLSGARKLRGVGHRFQRTAGGRQHLPEKARIRVPEPARILRTAARVGEERAFGMDPRDETLGGKDFEDAQRPQQLIGRGGDEAGQQCGGPVAVQKIRGLPAGFVVSRRESAAGRAVAVEIHKPGQQGAAGRQRELLGAGELRGIVAAAGSRVGDAAARHRHDGVRGTFAVAEEGAAQDVGRSGVAGFRHLESPQASRVRTAIR